MVVLCESLDFFWRVLSKIFDQPHGHGVFLFCVDEV